MSILAAPQNNGLELTSALANGLQRSQLNPVLGGQWGPWSEITR